jgi:hypothetical protein
VKYRSVTPLAMLVSLAVLANLVAPLLLDGFAARQAGLATFFVAVLLTLVFVYYAACNVPVIGDPHPRYTPGQSVGWFFVPVLNIYCGHQVLTALWRDSQPQSRVIRSRGTDFSVPAINIWLALTCAGIVLPIFLHMGSARATVIRGLHIAQGVAFIVVVLGIAARQREQWLDLERRRAVPQPTADALR